MSHTEDHMRRALRIALRGRGKVSPNPMVGAVLVKRGRVVGEGAHLQVGGPHAEANAFAQTGARARDADLYVTLEPCAFHGRTPPCVDAVIAAGVARVFCAMEDPDHRVAGRSFAKLRRAHIAGEVGIMEEQARRLNAAYVKHRTQNLPLTLLKLAQTLDGRIAARGGDARWITGAEARRYVHRWRSWVDAVIVGAGTVIADDPQLNVRHVKGRDPRPIVIDGKLRTSPRSRVFARPGAVLVTSEKTASRKRRAYAERGAEVWTFPARAGRIDLRLPLTRAAGEGMTSVLIEGGGELAAAALADRVVDQVHFYVAPRLMGTGVAAIGDLAIARAADAVQLNGVQTRRLGADLLYTAEVQYPCSPDS